MAVREGDIVVIRGRVTEVVGSDNLGVRIAAVAGEQQIRIRPSEVEVVDFVLEVGDTVQWPTHVAQISELKRT